MVVFKSDDGRKRIIRDYTNKISKKQKDIVNEKVIKSEVYQIKGNIKMYDGACFSLSLGQMKWLNKYKSINLNDWRYECLFDMPYPEFVYVGEGEKDINRKSNLEVDKYYYWPID